MRGTASLIDTQTFTNLASLIELECDGWLNIEINNDNNVDDENYENEENNDNNDNNDNNENNGNK